jgi:thiamine biosynthesis protein ThiI
LINTILLRYGEIHLKGDNRPYFDRMLMLRIQESLAGTPCKVYRGEGRFFVNGFEEKDADSVIDRLKKVFGLHSLSPAVECGKDLDEIERAALGLIEPLAAKHKTFKVRARRSDKHFPMNSMEICREMGGRILQAFPDLKVDVHRPDFYVDVEIREHAYVYAQSIRAAGGMPVGSNGKATLLLSGGIDSPVAGYLVAKRGVSINCVYFHSFPYTSERAKKKVVDLAEILSRYCGKMKLYVVNFTELQTKLYERCPQNQITILMRRMMMRIAEGIANKTGALGLVSGESIGQVASQTLQSMAVTGAVVKMPVYRPLVGMDKLEIIEKAQEIGTYETSILPYEDCCTVFVPKHPVTKPKERDMLVSEALLDYAPMVEQAIETAEMIEIGAEKREML